jgi:hypothetical protein
VSGRQHLLNDAIDEGALRGCDPDPVLVHTVEEATERPASGVGFAGRSSRLHSAAVRTPPSTVSAKTVTKIV